MIGIRNQRDCSINLTNKLFIISYVLFFSTTVTFLVFDAQSLFDYGFALYLLIAVITGLGLYLLLIWKFKEILDFIESCEEFIENRTYRLKI